MMVVILFTLTAALVAGWLRRRQTAFVLALVCLALTAHLFLWEIWSPEYGFRMPWIDTRAIPPRSAGQA